MSVDDRPSPKGRVLLLDGSVIYEWPMGLGLVLIMQWHEGDELTARIVTEEESRAIVSGRDAPPAARA